MFGIDDVGEAIQTSCSILKKLTEGKEVAGRHVTPAPKLAVKASTGFASSVAMNGWNVQTQPTPTATSIESMPFLADQ